MRYEKCILVPFPDYQEFVSQTYNNKRFKTVARYLEKEDLYLLPEDWANGVMKKLYGYEL